MAFDNSKKLDYKIGTKPEYNMQEEDQDIQTIHRVVNQDEKDQTMDDAVERMYAWKDKKK